jgi:hypothetical protein
MVFEAEPEIAPASVSSGTSFPDFSSARVSAPKPKGLTCSAKIQLCARIVV